MHAYSETNLTTASFRVQIIVLLPDSQIVQYQGATISLLVTNLQMDVPLYPADGRDLGISC